jgi:hypothetical protein
VWMGADRSSWLIALSAGVTMFVASSVVSTSIESASTGTAIVVCCCLVWYPRTTMLRKQCTDMARHNFIRDSAMFSTSTNTIKSTCYSKPFVVFKPVVPRR